MGLDVDSEEFTRPVDVIASSTWDGGGPGSETGNDNIWARHLIQSPGTAIGDPDVDKALSNESSSATHPEGSFGADFGQWHSTPGDPNEYLLFDMGASGALAPLHIWQANQTAKFDKGVQLFDVLVADDPAAFDPTEVGNPALWTPVLGNQSLAISGGGNIPSQDFDLGG